MNWKQFLKPDRRKIIIFLIFLIFFLVNFRDFPLDYGLPPWEERDGMIILGEVPGVNWSFFTLNIIFHLITTYTFSSFVVWTYGKFKKKPPSNRF